MRLLDDTWQTYSFDTAQTSQILGQLVGILGDMGVDFRDRQSLLHGFETLFHIEYINRPDFNCHNYILAPNHVSDFDALIVGLLHERIKVMSKKEWVDSEELMRFMRPNYDLVGIDRSSKIGQARALVEVIRYLRASGETRHALIFPQGTISDVNRNSIERVQSGVFILSGKSHTPIMPIFIEQPNFDHPTRIVFGEPFAIPGKDEDCRALWQARIIALQNGLNPRARTPVLTQKHSNNNKPEDPYF